MAALSPEILVLKDFLRPPAVVHAVRATYRAGGALRTHGHDFFECMWIERGTGRHVRNGHADQIGPGYLCVLGPEDTHSIRAGWSAPLELVNVAFAGTTAGAGLVNETLRRLHGGLTLRRAESIVGLKAAFSRLNSAPDEPLFLKRFLLDVVCEVELDARPASAPEVPGWLAAAVEQFQSSDRSLAEGAHALVSSSGRSRDHVNRTLHTQLGLTLSQYVARARVQRAAALLSTTSREVTQIAFDLGFGTLAYFYRQFKAQYGLAPGQYRDQQLRIARG